MIKKMTGHKTDIDFKRVIARTVAQDGRVQRSFDSAVAAAVAAKAIRNADMFSLSAEVDAHNIRVAKLAADKGAGMFKMLRYTFRLGLLASERAAIVAKLCALAGVNMDAHAIKLNAMNSVADGLLLPRLL